MTEILTTAAACAGTLLVAGTGIAVLPWTERERRAVMVAFRHAASASRQAWATIAAILRGTVDRRPVPAALPPGAVPWNSSCPPSIASSPGTAAT